MAWRLALRVARREAWRHKGRSALVAAMIALPVAGVGAADTLYRSSQVTPMERAVRDMGRYDAQVDAGGGGAVYQNPDGSQSGPVEHSGVSAPAQSTPGGLPGLLALLPAGSHVASPLAKAEIEARITEKHGRIWANLKEADLADPLQQGITHHRRGSAPAADDQAAISTSLAEALGKGVGDTIDVAAAATSPDSDQSQKKTLTITGIYDNPDEPYNNVLFVRPGVFHEADNFGVHYLVSVPGGVGWDLVQKFNAHGFTVESKNVIADPPPRSQVPYYTSGLAARYGHGPGLSAVAVATTAIAVSMVLLEVVLLAGPAFAVSARRRRRDFGLLGASGADGRRLRQIVLADGVVLGLVGGVVGVVVGVGAGAITLPYFSHLSRAEPGGFRLAPAELLAAAGIGVVTGIAAALAPAVTTARQDVLAALTGRRAQVGAPWKLPVAGLAGIGIGGALIFYGALKPGLNTLAITAGIAIAELGVVACTPLLVAWSGKLARLLPLTGRLALRDGARNRGRTAPAVAAIMAAVAGASALAMIISSDDAQGRAEYRTELRSGEAAVSWDTETSADPAQLTTQISAVLPVRSSAVVQGVVFDHTKPATMIPAIHRTLANRCPDLAVSALGDQAVYRAEIDQRNRDPRCARERGVMWSSHFSTGMSPLVSGGPELLRAMLGAEDKAAEDVLRGGGIVVFDPLDLTTPAPNPTATVELQMACTAPGGQTLGDPSNAATAGPCQPRGDTMRLPAAVAAAPRTSILGIVAPGALDRLGVTYAPVALLFDTSRMPTAAEEKKADDAVAAAGMPSRLYVERGYQSDTWIGLLAVAGVAAVVMLGAAAVATGLAITDAQGDLETLAAVGARPRVRRLLAGSQAAVTAGLGAALGAAFGLLPAIGLLEARAHGAARPPYFVGPSVDQKVYLAVPWLFLALVVLALPTLAAVGASGLTRSRIALTRRRE